MVNLPRLHIVRGPDEGRVIEISSPRFVIGRAAENDLHVPSEKISRQHAEIVCEAERYFLADLASLNGTFLNGERLATDRRRLNNGDEIQLASVMLLRFQDPATTQMDFPSPLRSLGLWVDIPRYEVHVQNKTLDPPLSAQLFSLLSLLFEHPGEVVTKDQIAGHVWPDAMGGVTDQMIDTLVARLRRRLAEVAQDHEYIVTIRGRGFKFVQKA
ncbi:MAG: FHA domain-containing protein [Chloroflexi bacterium]|nr:FHA domain-containing protein [Chloroflexota bacterium]